MKKHLTNVKHDYIRYSNCWEDAEVLSTGLNIKRGDRVLSIGSAGDNCFYLLVNKPELVVAADINTAQLHLIQLKKVAISQLEYEEFISLLGFISTENSKSVYDKIKHHLTPECKDYWEENIDIFDKGIIYEGKFEKYFKLFRTKILRLIHSKSKIEELFKTKTAEEQQIFFRKKWNNVRWRLLFRIFFSKYIMGQFGRDPAFLKQVKVPVSKYIQQLAADHLSSVYCQQNYFLKFILTGNYGEVLPPYARKENFIKIKEHINHLEIHSGLIEDALNKYGSFNKFNLSDIFEYMDTGIFRDVTEQLAKEAPSKSRFAYWNLLVPRAMHKVDERLTADALESIELKKQDKGFFYSNFLISVKR